MKMRLLHSVIFALAFAFPHELLSQVLAAKYSTFSGRIGGLNVEMELRNDNGQIKGWYNYYGKSSKLRLEGRFNEQEILTLKEYTKEGDFTGSFEGTLNSQNTFSGVWQNPLETSKLAFNLTSTNNTPLTDIDKTASSNEDEQIHKEKKRKMFQASKVKGFSKLALWVTIGLILIIVTTVIFLLRTKKSALAKQRAMYEHTKKEHYQNEHTPPKNQQDKTAARIGYEFEKLVVDLFPKNFYKIKYWSSDKISNNHTSAEASEYPDLLVEFNYKETKCQFAVECKYRDHLGTQGFEFTERQLDNYSQFEIDNNKKVFVAIGVAGTPYKPKEFYIIPLSEIKSTTLPIHQLKLFSKKFEKCQLFYNYKEQTLKIWNKEINNN